MSKQTHTTKEVDHAIIRFAGDSGDGMQLTGGRFSETTAIVGNDLSTLPDYPAEIRAPAGTLAGVSAFQLHFGSVDIHTPGDRPDVLVAMNPAALKVHLPELVPGGIIIVNENTFTPKNLKLAEYETNPIEDGSLKGNYTLYPVEMSKLVQNACSSLDIPLKSVERTKNLLALGILFWMFNRPVEPTIQWLKDKFAKKPLLVDANVRALNAGYNYGSTTRILTTQYLVGKAKLPAGTYRNIHGNYATALGFVAAAERSGMNLFYGGYPITPASEVLHALSEWKNFGIKTFQAEDEIAGVASAIGAAYAGNLAVTATSGPGVALKSEALGLAVMAEIPLVIVNVMRAGPSTGLPTKMEQTDLFQALFGRNGEAPIPVIAASTPGDCFYATYEACRIAVKYMMPVFVLTDGYLANGSEPWKIPNPEKLPKFKPSFVPERHEGATFNPMDRDQTTLARPWAIPGTAGLEHRIGGLEKNYETGAVCYDPDNHMKMVEIRAERIERIQEDIEQTYVYGEQSGDILVLSWGSSFGASRSAVSRIVKEGKSVGHAHLRWINPLPKDLGEILTRFKTVLIPEVNSGQLSLLIRATFLINTVGLNVVRSKPFKAKQIQDAINKELENIS